MSRDDALAAAIALHRQGALDQAEAAYRALLDTNPDDADILHLLGRLLLGRGRIDAAIPPLVRAGRLRPDHARIAFDLGEALSRRDRFAEARMAFERAVALDPGWADAWHRLGRTQSVLGDVAAARDSLRACLAREPEHLGALRDLAASGDTGVIPTLRRLHAQGGQTPEARMHLCFALAMALDRADDPDGAFPALAEANALLARSLAERGEGFDRAELRDFVDARIARATRASLDRLSGAGVADPAPVFIVGMPRSGTTLVERILASHPAMTGIGEGAWLSAAAAELGDLATVPPATVRAVATRQLAWLRLMAPGAARIIDKTPDNLFHLAEAACLFPGARVILCRRDPRDVCLSCHFQGFALPMPYANDLADCAFRVREAERMAAHWRAVLPLPMLELRYETLVAEPEATIRAMLSFLDMPWDPACLRFHASGGAVTSASVWQVRRPLHAGAVGRWRAYRDHIAPLLAAFGDADQPIGPAA